MDSRKVEVGRTRGSKGDLPIFILMIGWSVMLFIRMGKMGRRAVFGGIKPTLLCRAKEVTRR